MFTALKLAFKNLKGNMLRTALSLSGVVIGVMSVILVMSFGAGVKSFVVSEVESFGTDIIEIEVKVPKTGKTSHSNVVGQMGGTVITTLKLEDVIEISRLKDISGWYGGLMGQENASYRENNEQAMLMGVTSGFWEIDEQSKLQAGRYFSKHEANNSKQVIIVGSKLKKEFSPQENLVGKNIKLKGQAYEVIGVLEKRGSTGFFDFDSLIYLPLKTLQNKITGDDHIQFAIFKVEDKNKMEFVGVQITNILRERHNTSSPDEDDFSVNSITEMSEMIDSVFGVINILLLALTSISLIVGGVGVMNVMYVAVSERTFEIGLRKSLGARNSDILKQFMLEALFLTLAGGALGIIAGALGSYAIELVATYWWGYDLRFEITLEIISIGFLFSAFVGLIFGIRPAQRAAQLSPMEALRKR